MVFFMVSFDDNDNGDDNGDDNGNEDAVSFYFLLFTFYLPMLPIRVRLLRGQQHWRSSIQTRGTGLCL